MPFVRYHSTLPIPPIEDTNLSEESITNFLNNEDFFSSGWGYDAVDIFEKLINKNANSSSNLMQILDYLNRDVQQVSFILKGGFYPDWFGDRAPEIKNLIFSRLEKLSQLKLIPFVLETTLSNPVYARLDNKYAVAKFITNFKGSMETYLKSYHNAQVLTQFITEEENPKFGRLIKGFKQLEPAEYNRVIHNLKQHELLYALADGVGRTSELRELNTDTQQLSTVEHIIWQLKNIANSTRSTSSKKQATINLISLNVQTIPNLSQLNELLGFISDKRNNLHGILNTHQGIGMIFRSQKNTNTFNTVINCISQAKEPLMKMERERIGTLKPDEVVRELDSLQNFEIDQNNAYRYASH